MKVIDAHKLAKEINDKLRADDCRFNCAVKLLHGDGTVMFLEYAFVEKHDDWVFIFSEHNGYHIYHSSDLTWVQYKETDRGGTWPD